MHHTTTRYTPLAHYFSFPPGGRAAVVTAEIALTISFDYEVAMQRDRIRGGTGAEGYVITASRSPEVRCVCVYEQVGGCVCVFPACVRV